MLEYLDAVHRPCKFCVVCNKKVAGTRCSLQQKPKMGDQRKITARGIVEFERIVKAKISEHPEKRW